MKNRKELLAFAQANGYKGRASLADLRAWFVEQGHEPDEIRVVENGKTIVTNIDELWKVVPTIEVKGTKEENADDLGDDAIALRARLADVERKAREAEAKAAADKRLASAEDGGVDGKARDNKGAGFFGEAAEFKRYNKLAAEGKTVFPDAELAQVAGAHAMLTMAQHDPRFRSKVRWSGADEKRFGDILKKAQVTYDNILGGYLVPREMDSYYIDIKTAYSGVRNLFRVVQCNDAGIDVPKRTGGVTVYSPVEGGTITASSMNVGNVHITPVKFAALTQISPEMIRSSPMSIGEKVVSEMAYAFAQKEEECFLVGDGTATYFGITGIVNALYNLSGTVANIAGVVVQGTSNTWSAQTIGDLEATFGRLEDKQTPLGGLKWLCHRRYWAEVIIRLVKASGGETSLMFNGKPTPVLFGDEIVTSNAMPRVTATTGLFLLYGDFKAAATIADVAGVQVDTSTEYAFASDLVTIRATQKVGFAAHDVGNASATQASRIPGPVVGLATA